MLRHLLPCCQSFPHSPLNHAHGKLLPRLSKEGIHFHLEPKVKQSIQFLLAKVVFRVCGVLVFRELEAFAVLALQRLKFSLSINTEGRIFFEFLK